MNSVAWAIAGLATSLGIWLCFGQGNQLVKSQIDYNNARAGIVKPVKPLEGWTVYSSNSGEDVLSKGAVKNGAKRVNSKPADIIVDAQYHRQFRWLLSPYIRTVVTCRNQQWIVNEFSDQSDDQFRQILAEILAIVRTSH